MCWFRLSRLTPHIKYVSFHSLLPGVIHYISFSLRLWFHRSFVSGGEMRENEQRRWRNRQKHCSIVHKITSLTCTLMHVPGIILDRGSPLRWKDINTHTYSSVKSSFRFNSTHVRSYERQSINLLSKSHHNVSAVRLR